MYIVKFGYGDGVASRLLQGILAAVLSSMLGANDPDRVASMAKQAGEVRHPSFLLPFYRIVYFLTSKTHLFTYVPLSQ